MQSKNLDTQIVVGVLITVILLIALITFIIAIVLLYQRKIRDKQKQMFQSIIDAEETERNRIAKDLHDSLGASLSAIKLYFESLMPTIADVEKSKLVYTMLSDSCNEVRSISHQMMPQVLLNEGIYTATRQFCAPLMQMSEPKFELIILGEEHRPKKINTELMIYRVMQELVNNSIKHSNAKNITVQIISNKNELILSVEDDGIGIDQEKLNSSKGLGINNLKSRVQFINGQLSIDSQEESGCLAVVRIPL